MGRALVGVLVGELYAATAGIGFMITVAGATFQTDKVFVGILIFATSGVVLTTILDRVERRFDKWQAKSRGCCIAVFDSHRAKKNSGYRR